jgi:hypothetical protein
MVLKFNNSSHHSSDILFLDGLTNCILFVLDTQCVLPHIEGMLNVVVCVCGLAACDDVDWIHPALERGQCRAPVNTVMNLQVPYTGGGDFEYLMSC